MGFLTLNTDIDLTQVIISFWFRIPSATANTANTTVVGGEANTSFATARMVPFITFGPQYDILFANTFIGCEPFPIDSHCAFPEYPCSIDMEGQRIEYLDGTNRTVPGGGPTYIGAYYPGISALSPAPGSLIASLQMSVLPSIVNAECDITSHFVNTEGVCEQVTTDNTALLNVFLDAYGTGYLPTNPNFGSLLTTGAMVASPDIWHHLLISWDIGNGCASHGNDGSFIDQNWVDAVSNMWHAFDDTNYDSSDLLGTWANFANSSSFQVWGPNDIISNLPLTYADQNRGCSGGGAPTYTQPGGGLVSNPITIPAPLSMIMGGDGGGYDMIQQIEMAELQVFTSITLDTSVMANRRLFVDDAGFPVDGGIAAASLGKQQDIWLAKSSSNWAGGINLGTAGNFTPVGTINPYTPSPQVGH
jgi:hypothetical protein